jgi:hypothetical protein
LIVLWSVFREGPVTTHRILGAIAAYLLLAVCFSAYDLIAYADPGAFHSGRPKLKAASQGLVVPLFQRSDLTTVGSGDIAASPSYARSW